MRENSWHTVFGLAHYFANCKSKVRNLHSANHLGELYNMYDLHDLYGLYLSYILCMMYVLYNILG